MTRKQKLSYHLEMIIWESLPEGMRLTAAQVEELVAKADDSQRLLAYQRALVMSPMLIDHEIRPQDAGGHKGAYAE